MMFSPPQRPELTQKLWFLSREGLVKTLNLKELETMCL